MNSSRSIALPGWCWIFAVLGAVLGPDVSRAAEGPPAPAPPPRYRVLRYDEDYTYLRTVQGSDVWDGVKFVALGEESHFSVGGELRERFEYLRNSGTRVSDSALLQRVLLHGDLHVTPAFRLFVQVASASSFGRNAGPRPGERDDFDLQQAFGDVAVGATDRLRATLRVGRQELAFGSQRLVGVRDPINVRLRFDAVHLIGEWGRNRADAFISRPVAVKPGVIDDAWDKNQLFWGLYTAFPIVERALTLDVWALGIHRKEARFDQGTAEETRQGFGVRLSGQVGAVDYNTELMGAVGRFGEADIRAWSVATQTGYAFAGAPLKPKLSLRASMISGDTNPNDGVLRTWNPFFPKLAIIGDEQIVSGPSNFTGFAPRLDFQLLQGLSAWVDWLFTYRQQRTDGLYSPAVQLVRTGQTSAARFVGSQLTASVEWRPDVHLFLTLLYARSSPGAFLRETGSGGRLNSLALRASYTF